MCAEVTWLKNGATHTDLTFILQLPSRRGDFLNSNVVYEQWTSPFEVFSFFLIILSQIYIFVLCSCSIERIGRTWSARWLLQRLPRIHPRPFLPRRKREGWRWRRWSPSSQSPPWFPTTSTAATCPASLSSPPPPISTLSSKKRFSSHEAAISSGLKHSSKLLWESNFSSTNIYFS